MNDRRAVLVIGTVVVCLALVGTCVGAWVLIKYLSMPAERRALPSSATEIEDWLWVEGGLTGQDYRYLLKAKITESEFQQYVDRLGLAPYSPSRDYGPYFILNWGPPVWLLDEDLVWWDPDSHSDSDDAYVSGDGSWWRYAKYENGYVYVVSHDM